MPIKQIEPEDEDFLEEWLREAENDYLNISACKLDEEWPWQVGIWLAEFVREEPHESDLVNSIESALANVNGVTEVVHEDREIWLVKGDVTGDALIKTCIPVVDRMYQQADID